MSNKRKKIAIIISRYLHYHPNARAFVTYATDPLFPLIAAYPVFSMAVVPEVTPADVTAVVVLLAILFSLLGTKLLRGTSSERS